MLDRPPLTNGQVPAPPNETRTLARRANRRTAQPAQAPNAELVTKEFTLNGTWVPSLDPLVIGEGNYSMVQNLRYRQSGLQSVSGYSRLTTAVHGTYTKGRSGIQFYKPVNAGLVSMIMVHAENAGLTQSAILFWPTEVPNTGTYNATVGHTDAAGAGLGRFSLAPDQNVAYGNGREALIWGGEEHRVSAFLVVNSTGSIRRDYTEAVRSVLTDALHVANVHIDGSTAPLLLIATTRPVSAFKLYVGTPNAVASTIAVDYWGAGGYTAVSNLVDGTAAGGATLAQTGSLTFDSTVNVALPKFDGGYVLYFYRLTVSAATTPATSITYATADLPLQPVKDVWDGAYREPVQFQVDLTGSYHDHTQDVLEAESSTSAFFASLGGLDSSGGDDVVVGFTERAQAIKIAMVGTQVNANGATLTVSYWNGSGWVGVSNMEDGTLNVALGRSLAQSGVIWWTPPAASSEFPQTLFGVTAYYYRLTWGAALSATVSIDHVQGIPASRDMTGSIFPWQFQGILFLMGDLVGNQAHAAEFSAPNAPDVWNGEATSGGGKRIFFGEGGKLSGAIEVYNRFAGSLAYLGLVCKDTETYVLSGNDPESFQVFPLSKTLGCPAPLTMASAEVAYSVAEDAQRNIALWCSLQGPVICDASVILPIPGVECYFDPKDTRYINTAAIEQARGWYDPEYKEYHLLLPSGAGQTTCNVWLTLDLRRQKWRETVPPTYPQGVVPVKDLNGRAYAYGLLDTGHLMRLEDGITWDGTLITQRLATAELFPAGGTFEETLLRYVRLIVVRKAWAPVSISVLHFADSEVTGTVVASVDISAGTTRLVMNLTNLNRKARSHRLLFQLIGGEGASEWLHWAGIWQKEGTALR